MKKRAGNGVSLQIPLRCGAASDIGKIRDENQDAYLVEPDLALFLVSDGMGGHQGGAVASQIVAEFLPTMIKERLKKLRSFSTKAIRSMLKKTISELNRHTLIESASATGFRGMGATVVMALLMDERAYIANVGDSRLYRLRKGRLLQLTEEHSVVCELLQEGEIKPAESENHPERDRLTRCIGIDDEAKPYVRTIALKGGNRLLLCSDGLTDVIDDKSIAAMLKSEANPQAACEALVGAANAAGGYDNVTVVIVDWLSDS